MDGVGEGDQDREFWDGDGIVPPVPFVKVFDGLQVLVGCAVEGVVPYNQLTRLADGA